MRNIRWFLLFVSALFFHAGVTFAQINTNRVMMMGRNALFYEDYVLAIQRFNMVISARPYLSEPYFFRGLAKFYLEDFTGAESDCSESLVLNPYVANSYQLRGLCRVNLKHYADAIADYEKVLEMEPKNRTSWHNLVLCHFELKQYADADSALNQMIRYWPKESENYTMKAQAAIQQGDTITGLAMIDTALVINAYDGQAWTMRSMISLQRGLYEQAEVEIDKAIVQLPRVAGNYVNRALARFHRNNLRGAMSDYDQALEIDPNNYLGHFNRGLLRARVGDDNRAIEDFNFVLAVEPDNMIALYNRALLLDNTGDFRGAIRDISAVIDEYPDFMTGYQQRAAIRRKIGDIYGAERDEFKVMKDRMDALAGVRKKTQHKTRKQSDRNMDDYASLVEADTDEPTREYASDYRGRVQDHKVELQPMPLIVACYHRSQSITNRYVPFYKQVEQLNNKKVLPSTLLLTDSEPTLTESQLRGHFASIAELTQRIDSLTASGRKIDANLFVARALDEYHVRDFEAAQTDLERAVALDGQTTVVGFLAVQMRLRQIEATIADPSNLSASEKLTLQRLADELKRLVANTPDFTYAWYNLGNVYLVLHEYSLARNAYTKALNIDPRFPNAYYNRAIACIHDGQVQLGLSDLSQAGEYGLYGAYNLIKRYSKDVPKASKGGSRK